MLYFIGKNIRFFRKKKNFSIKNLSKRTGISSITLYRYENGKREPKITYLKKIAQSLGVSIKDLLDPSITTKEKN